LDFLGVAAGLYKSSIHTTIAEAVPGPNSLAPPGEDHVNLDASQSFSQLTNPDIVKALSCAEAFDELYLV
jgi:hypothetical protein